MLGTPSPLAAAVAAVGPILSRTLKKVLDKYFGGITVDEWMGRSHSEWTD